MQNLAIINCLGQIKEERAIYSWEAALGLASSIPGFSDSGIISVGAGGFSEGFTHSIALTDEVFSLHEAKIPQLRSEKGDPQHRHKDYA